MTPYPEYQEDLAVCTDIHKSYGKSFYFGTFFLNRAQRDATCVLYAFFRLPDQMVDTEQFGIDDELIRDATHDDAITGQEASARTRLEQWKAWWHAAYAGEPYDAEGTDRKVLRATAYVFHAYKIPFAYGESFLAAMIQDTQMSRYENYAELEAYMYGSAVVVGLMMTYLFYGDDSADARHFHADQEFRDDILNKAGSLAEAFQMTNFLRDVGEDMRIRDRIYIPLEDMAMFGVTEQDIVSENKTANFVKLMQYEMKRNRKLYEKGDMGIAQLPKQAAKGVRIARVLYAAIEDKVAQQGYDVFSSRAHLTFVQKLMKALPLIV